MTDAVAHHLPRLAALSGASTVKQTSDGVIEIKYQAPEAPKSSPPGPKYGSALFNDAYDHIKLFSVAFLVNTNIASGLLGLTVGALKPYLNYTHGHVPKAPTGAANPGDLGKLIAVDHYIDYNPKKRKGNSVSGLTTYLALSAIPLFVVDGFKECSPGLSHTLTFILTSRIGYDWSQRLIHWLSAS